ncbi:DENN domain-containing protein 2C [Zootermopsis nevadensis]|uniref:DENN domain-containing protein 2C n=1 Tax=Zootermopsis nevadensis TaxID=136037 RepID=A0A067R984_ZOONE|nr:DENN domain-containing protein 2C [Zootermopsis nevadensis]
MDSRLEERDLAQLFSAVPVPVLLQLFGSLLLERRVILISNSLSRLSSCVEAVQSILYPFSWQHTLIPVLPTSLLDICLSPTPYIVGILRGRDSSTVTEPIDEMMMVDLDESQVLRSVGDESSILPSRLRRCLKVALQLVTNTTQPWDASRNVLVSEAFVRMFVEVCGHYRNHIVTQQDGMKVFERESFIKAVTCQSFRLFLEWFTETAMFSAFIESHLDSQSDVRGR